MAIASYLRRTSDRGNFSYRRAVPEDCRPFWGKREHKESLKTKSHPEALRRAAQVNTTFDTKVARIRQMNSGFVLPTDQQIQEAKDILLREGIHPQQIPRNKAEADKFFERQEEWSGQYLDAVDTKNGYNSDGTIWTTYHENKKSPYFAAHEILKARQTASIVPTLAEATDNYLKVNAEKATRTPHNQHKHEQRVRRAVAQLGPLDTTVADYNRLKARQHKETLPNSSPQHTKLQGLKFVANQGRARERISGGCVPSRYPRTNSTLRRVKNGTRNSQKRYIGQQICGYKSLIYMIFWGKVVRSRGLEPPRVLPHSDLNAARLPIPPRPHCPDQRRHSEARGRPQDQFCIFGA